VSGVFCPTRRRVSGRTLHPTDALFADIADIAEMPAMEAVLRARFVAGDPGATSIQTAFARESPASPRAPLEQRRSGARGLGGSGARGLSGLSSR
jgi:hypothetical protein